MSKIKFFIVFIFFSFLVIFSVNGQNTTLERKVSEIDSLMYAYKGEIALPIIDSLLEKKLPINRELHLKAFKLEALVQTEKIESALNFSNKILKNKNLKGIPLIRTFIERALIYELIRELKESQRALDFVKNYYQNSNATKDELYGEYLYRQSSLYRAQENKNKALEFAERGRIFGMKNNFSNVEATSLFLKFALSKNSTSKSNLALNKKALRLWEKSNNSNYTVSIYLNIARYYMNLKEYKTSHKYLDSILILNKGIINLADKVYITKLKSEVYEKERNLKQALHHYKKFKKDDDLHTLNVRIKEISEINAKFNYEKESLKNEALEQNLTNEKEQKNSLIIGLIVVLVLLSILILLAMNLVKKRKEIKSKNVDLTVALDKNKLLLRELNHRVNNNLALILSLVKFQYYEIDEPKYKDKFQSLEHRIKTIAAAHEQLLYNKENIEGEKYDVQEYITKITNGLTEISTKNIQLHLNAKNIKLNIDTMLPIGILINELMSNSIKHAMFKDVLIIDIQISLQQSNITVLYKDSGSSFIEKTNTKSLGVSIIKSMVKQLKGTIKRTNSEYTITLQLKNSEK